MLTDPKVEKRPADVIDSPVKGVRILATLI